MSLIFNGPDRQFQTSFNAHTNKLISFLTTKMQKITFFRYICVSTFCLRIICTYTNKNLFLLSFSLCFYYFFFLFISNKYRHPYRMHDNNTWKDRRKKNYHPFSCLVVVPLHSGISFIVVVFLFSQTDYFCLVRLTVECGGFYTHMEERKYHACNIDFSRVFGENSLKLSIE